MGKSKNKNKKKNPSQQSQQSPQQSKSHVNSCDADEEPQQQGILSSVIGSVTQIVSSAANAVVGSSKPEKEPEIKVNSVSDQIEEKVPEVDMGKRSIKEIEEKNEEKEEPARSPEEKRHKYERDLNSMDKDVVEVIVKMKEMSSKQKKKYKANLKIDNLDLYNRYIAQNTNRPDGNESPEKPVKSVEKEEKIKPDSSDKTADTPKKSPVKLNRNTPLNEPKDSDDDKAAAKEVLDAPVNWEDEAWDQDDAETVEDIKKSEVEEYERELKTASGELPKDREKIKFGFTKEANTSNWDKDNVGWTESNQKKKEKKEDYKPVRQERKEGRGNRQDQNEGARGYQEQHQGARAKEGSSGKKKNKKNKRQTKITDYDQFPPGHPNYVPPSERPQYEPHQYSAGGSGKRSRSSSASRQKAWEPQTIKRGNGSIILQEVYGDLFSASDYHSLVHCVSADFHMGKGIAVQFKKRFGGVGDLLSFNAHTGGMAFLRRRERFIYYLVTKEQYNKKPTMRSLQSSLSHMRAHCMQNRVQYIAMPCIGCGLDKLDWFNVRDMLVAMFRDTPIEITVYWG